MINFQCDICGKNISAYDGANYLKMWCLYHAKDSLNADLISCDQDYLFCNKCFLTLCRHIETLKKEAQQ